MFYNVVKDGDAVSYVPTTAGKILLIVILAVLLAAAAFFARKRAVTKKPPTGAPGADSPTKRRFRQDHRQADGFLRHGHCPGHSALQPEGL